MTPPQPDHARREREEDQEEPAGCRGKRNAAGARPAAGTGFLTSTRGISTAVVGRGEHFGSRPAGNGARLIEQAPRAAEEGDEGGILRRSARGAAGRADKGAAAPRAPLAPGLKSVWTAAREASRPLGTNAGLKSDASRRGRSRRAWVSAPILSALCPADRGALVCICRWFHRHRGTDANEGSLRMQMKVPSFAALVCSGSFLPPAGIPAPRSLLRRPAGLSKPSLVHGVRGLSHAPTKTPLLVAVLTQNARKGTKGFGENPEKKSSGDFSAEQMKATPGAFSKQTASESRGTPLKSPAATAGNWNPAPASARRGLRLAQVPELMISRAGAGRRDINRKLNHLGAFCRLPAAAGRGLQRWKRRPWRFCSLPKALPTPHLLCPPRVMGSGRAVPFPEHFSPD